MEKRFYLVIALQGAGKSSATEVLKKLLNASSHRYSDPVREFADDIGLPQERKPMQDIAQAMRRQFGADCLERLLIQRGERDAAEDVIFDGAREPKDVGNLVKHPSFHAIHIDLPELARFRRISKREQAEGRPVPTWEQFLQAENHVNERSIRDTLALIGNQRPDRLHIVDNSRTPDELRRRLEDLVSYLRGR